MAIINSKNQKYNMEHMGFAQFPLVSWRSIFAGLVLSTICYAAISALGVAIMGASANDIINSPSQNASGLALATGVWIVLSAFFSLLVGGYFSARISNLVTAKVGGAQGIVIASLFFSLLLFGAGSAVGFLGKSMGSTVKSLSNSAGGLFSSEVVQDAVEQTFEGLNLKSSPEVVAKGVATRLIRGDNDGAKSYLAYQAGVSNADVDARIMEISKQVSTGMQRASAATTQGMQAAGFTVFLTMVLGVVSCCLGGVFGASANNRKPLVDQIVPIPFTNRNVG